MDPETDYGSPAWRKNHSKTRLDMHADPKKGPALREKMSKTMTAKYADPKKGPAVREKQSMGQYGPAGPPGESKDEMRARVEGLLERVKQRAMTAQASPGNINWPEEDDLLVIKHVQTFGDVNFAALAEQFGGRHCRQTCKSRWTLNLDPDGPRNTGSAKNAPAGSSELKRQRRKQSSRECMRRLRLRRQAECEELGSRVGSLADDAPEAIPGAPVDKALALIVDKPAEESGKGGEDQL